MYPNLAALTLLLTGTAVTLITLAATRNRLPRQKNYRNMKIPTATGMVLIPIILLGMVLGGVLLGWSVGSLAFLLYALLAAVVGYVDDVYGSSESRGFGGHLGALLRGRVTTGMVKVVALGGGAVVLASVLVSGPAFAPASAPVGVAVNGGIFSVIIASVLVAGSVNLANLLDVRPARTLKFLGIPVLALILAVPEAARGAALLVVGGALALAPLDLRGRVMLGDSGAAVVGAVFGYLVVMSGSYSVWGVALVVVVGLTVVAEVSSISALIGRVGLLRKLDRWGRDL